MKKISIANWLIGGTVTSLVGVAALGTGLAINGALAQFAPGPGSGGGSVSSVAVTMPSEFSVSGSPVTTSGIIAVSKASQGTATFYAAPSASSGTPTFRVLSDTDAVGLANWRLQSASAPVAFRFNTYATTDNYLNGVAPVYKIGTPTLTGSLGFYAAPIGTTGNPITFNTGATLSPLGIFDFPTGITVPTRTAGDSTTNAASTAFVTGGIATAVSPLAPIASPTFTGTPAAPTAPPGTSTTQLATTAFVTTADNLKAPLASPALTGTPTAPTATVGTNTTQVATTAFVSSAIANTGWTCSTPVTLSTTYVPLTTLPAGINRLEIYIDSAVITGLTGFDLSTGGVYGGTYNGSATGIFNGTSPTVTSFSGYWLLYGQSATIQAVVRLHRTPSTNVWIGDGSSTAGTVASGSAGRIAMSGVIDAVRVRGTGLSAGTAYACYSN